MSSRILTKILAGIQDLQTGIGSESQVRGKATISVNRVDVPVAVNTSAEIQNIVTSQYQHARLYIDTELTLYIDYRFDSAASTGGGNIVPNNGGGAWVPVKPVVVSPNGTNYQIDVSDAGVLSTTVVS